jgi:hypothetical protein
LTPADNRKQFNMPMGGQPFLRVGTEGAVIPDLAKIAARNVSLVHRLQPVLDHRLLSGDDPRSLGRGIRGSFHHFEAFSSSIAVLMLESSLRRTPVGPRLTILGRSLLRALHDHLVDWALTADGKVRREVPASRVVGRARARLPVLNPRNAGSLPLPACAAVARYSAGETRRELEPIRRTTELMR